MVEGARLEIVYWETDRGFESHPLRQLFPLTGYFPISIQSPNSGIAVFQPGSDSIFAAKAS